MRRHLLLLPLALAACGRSPAAPALPATDTAPVEVVADIVSTVDARSDDTEETPREDAHDSQSDIGPDVPDVCSVEDLSIPAEGSPCEVEGQQRCAKEMATVASGRAFMLSSDPYYRFSDAQICHRPRRLTCVKGASGSLTWIGDFCYQPYLEYALGPNHDPSKEPLLVPKYGCQEFAGAASCCPFGSCQPKQAGMTWCGGLKCHRFADMSVPLQDLYAANSPFSKAPLEQRKCLMWLGHAGCQPPECLICKKRPGKDIQCQCGGPEPKCEQISPFEIKCIKGCESYGYKKEHCQGDKPNPWE